MEKCARVISCGSYLPEKVLTNRDLESMVDTSDEWIISRSGIHQRHIAAEGEFTSDLATAASQQALTNAGIKADEIDLIIVATTTPDHTFPACAVEVQTKIGANKAFAFDVQAVCTGFIYALSIADKFIKSGQVKTALVIGAEAMSRIVDWSDRTTCVLFGDGAGAVVVKADSADAKSGILSTHLFSDGQYKDALYVDGGAAQSSQKVGHIRMQGREVFRHAVNKIGSAIEEALEHNNLKTEDIDWFVPHQANKRIIDTLADKFKLPPEKVVVTLESQGNTSAASVPLALAEAVNDGRIKKDQLILCEAMGGGFTWGSVAIRW